MKENAEHATQGPAQRVSSLTSTRKALSWFGLLERDKCELVLDFFFPPEEPRPLCVMGECSAIEPSAAQATQCCSPPKACKCRFHRFAAASAMSSMQEEARARDISRFHINLLTNFNRKETYFKEGSFQP